MATCATCKHFIGGGDWNLCCDLKYDLYYKDTLACDKYEFSKYDFGMIKYQEYRGIYCKDCKHYELEWLYCLKFGCHTLEDDMCGEFKRKKKVKE